MRHDTVDRALIAQVCEQPPRRELSLAERPLTWLIERHAELMKWVPKGRAAIAAPRAVRLELESIEDEIMDRADQGELRYDNDAMFKQVQEIILRGQSR